MKWITHRHLADVVPEYVAEAQNLWELRQLALRARKAGISMLKIREKLGRPDKPLERYVFSNTSPLENYLNQELINLRPKAEDNIAALRLQQYLDSVDPASFKDHPSLVALRKRKLWAERLKLENKERIRTYMKEHRDRKVKARCEADLFKFDQERGTYPHYIQLPVCNCVATFKIGDKMYCKRHAAYVALERMIDNEMVEVL